MTIRNNTRGVLNLNIGGKLRPLPPNNKMTISATEAQRGETKELIARGELIVVAEPKKAPATARKSK